MCFHGMLQLQVQGPHFEDHGSSNHRIETIIWKVQVFQSIAPARHQRPQMKVVISGNRFLQDQSLFYVRYLSNPAYSEESMIFKLLNTKA